MNLIEKKNKWFRKSFGLLLAGEKNFMLRDFYSKTNFESKYEFYTQKNQKKVILKKNIWGPVNLFGLTKN